MKKFSALFLAILLAACTSSPATTLSILPTGTPEIQRTNAAPLPATSTPVIGVAAFVAPPAPVAGEKLGFESLDMIDSNTGWGIDNFGRIFHTGSGGETWTFSSPPAGAYTASGFFALDGLTAWAAKDVPVRCWDYLAIYQCDQPYYAAVKSGTVWKTTDGGVTWQPSQPFLLNAEKAPYSFDGALPFSPLGLQFIDPQTGWLLAAVGQTPAGEQSILYRTHDGGATWEILQTFGFDANAYSCHERSFAFTDERSGWLAAECTDKDEKSLPMFLRTTDGGATWSSTDPIPVAQNGEFFRNVNHGWRLYLDQSTHERWLQKTLDGGQTWESTKSVAWTTARFEFVDAQKGWAIVTGPAGLASLVKTTNGGRTWGLLAARVAGGETLTDSNPSVATPQNAEPVNIAEIWMINDLAGWAMTEDEQLLIAENNRAVVNNNQLLHTLDGGHSWQNITPPAEYKAYQDQCRYDTIITLGGLEPEGFFAIDAEHAWMAQNGCDPALIAVWKTIDGGQSWRKIALGAIPPQPDIMPAFLSPISLSFDDAAHGWLAADLYAGNRSFDGFLFRTQDGGDSWQLVSNEPLNCYPYCVGAVSSTSQSIWLADDPRHTPADCDFLDFPFSNDGGKTWQRKAIFDVGETPFIPDNPILTARIGKLDWGTDFRCGTVLLKKFPHGSIGAYSSCYNTFPAAPFLSTDYLTIMDEKTSFATMTNGMSVGVDIDDFYGSFGWTTNQSEFFYNTELGWRLYLGIGMDEKGPVYLQRTQDGGDTWKTITPVLWQDARFQFLDAQNGWALVTLPWGKALVHTSDGGQTWTEIEPVVANP